MNAITQTPVLQQQVPIGQPQATNVATQNTTNASTQTVENAPIALAKQDASDVVRQGTSGRVKVNREIKKETAKKLLKSMSKEKQTKLDNIATEVLSAITARKPKDEQNQDLDFARQEVEDLLQQYLGDEFDDAEKIAFLSKIQDNSLVRKDTVLTKAVQKTMDEIYFNSAAAHIAFSSTTPLNKALFKDGSEERAFVKEMLTYTNQDAFLQHLEEDFGIDKLQNHFPALCTTLMTKFSASMQALSSISSQEKSAFLSTVSAISSLQQLQGVYQSANTLITRMHPKT